MINAREQQELKKDAESGNYQVKELLEKYNLSDIEYYRYKKKLGFKVKDGGKSIPQHKIRFILENPSLSTYALSLETEISFYKVKEIRENLTKFNN